MAIAFFSVVGHGSGDLFWNDEVLEETTRITDHMSALHREISEKACVDVTDIRRATMIELGTQLCNHAVRFSHVSCYRTVLQRVDAARIRFDDLCEFTSATTWNKKFCEKDLGLSAQKMSQIIDRLETKKCLTNTNKMHANGSYQPVGKK